MTLLGQVLTLSALTVLSGIVAIFWLPAIAVSAIAFIAMCVVLVVREARR